jgi:hypothetical protein
MHNFLGHNSGHNSAPNSGYIRVNASPDRGGRSGGWSDFQLPIKIKQSRIDAVMLLLLRRIISRFKRNIICISVMIMYTHKIHNKIWYSRPIV